MLFSFVSFSIFHIGLVMETKFLYCRTSSNCFYSAQCFSFILHSCEALLTQFGTFELDTSFVAAVVSHLKFKQHFSFLFSVTEGSLVWIKCGQLVIKLPKLSSVNKTVFSLRVSVCVIVVISECGGQGLCSTHEGVCEAFVTALFTFFTWFSLIL